jgi:hypothetical protein
MIYTFEMCDIVFIKTETPESRQIESQDCLKFHQLHFGTSRNNTENMGFRQFFRRFLTLLDESPRFRRFYVRLKMLEIA